MRDSHLFSPRLPARLEQNALSRALEQVRSIGTPLIDLTLTNPTQAGFEYPRDVLRALSTPDAGVYRPQPLGSRSAREAVAADYARRGVNTTWERIVLTASTSEAYSFLFKLLCAPSGESVLVPSPSYPLFDHLTALDGVNAVPYRLDYDGRWRVNFDSVDVNWDARVRAVLAVSPNNPTGSMLTIGEHDAFLERCAVRGGAVIVDEVFADYPVEGGSASDDRANDRALRFRLGGLSKSAALPQVKLGWIAIDGPDAVVDAALERLELICDTYLSVSTPVQVATAELIASGALMRRQVLDRVRANYETLRRLVEDHPSVAVLPVEGGWSAVLRIPARDSEEQIALDLLTWCGVIVHPGFFFDFPHEAFLVISLLPGPDEFREGMCRVLERVDA
jgi:alanine-synthesizing transaminase